MFFNLKAFLGNFPELIQYVIIIGLVLLIIYASLFFTRVLGKRLDNGERVYYDDPEAYDKEIPDLFAATPSKRKLFKKNTGESKSSSEKDDKH